MSMWGDAAEAARREHEQALQCPKCGAMNRPRAVLVDLEASGAALCRVCSFAWQIGPVPTTESK